MLKRICFLTATRAEYGLLRPIIKGLMKIPEFDVRVSVTGAHLSPEFGLTYREIEKDGIPIDEKVFILLSADTPASVSTAMGLAMIGFAGYFDRLKPDMLVVLGDRYETLAVCCAAVSQRIPVAHLYGGETTEGALDDYFRHAITKLAYLHFTSTETYRNRVIQMGEHPERVFCVGAVGIENALHENLLSREKLAEATGICADDPFALVTFHPVTQEVNHSAAQFEQILKFCESHPEMLFVFTKANADAHGRILHQMTDHYATHHSNGLVFASLGVNCYLSAMKHCTLIIGNSSSGLIEAPSFFKPVIDIGDRQKGRIRADNVIHCNPSTEEIESAYRRALSPEFQRSLLTAVNPYGNGRTSEKVVSILKEFLLEGFINLQKSFYESEVKE